MMEMDPEDHEIVELLYNLYVLHQLFKKYRFSYGNNGRFTPNQTPCYLIPQISGR